MTWSAIERPTLECCRAGSLESFSALESEWRRLEEACGACLPFVTFDWAFSWWKHFAESRKSIRDTLWLRAVRERTGALVAVAPLMLTERPAAGPVRLRAVQFFGADANITEVRGMLCLRGREREATFALLADLRACASEYDWIVWSGVRKDSPAEGAVRAFPDLPWDREIPDYVLTLAGDWETFRKGLKPNIKESLRKCYHSLEREHLTFTFEVARRPDEMQPALERFLALHGLRAGTLRAVAHRNVFGDEAERRFLLEVVTRMAGHGRARVFMLRVEGEVVASRIGFVLGDSLYLYYSGYDPAWGRFSVMTTLVAEAIKWAMREGLRTVNLSTGTDVSKTRWGPIEHVYRELAQSSPGRRGRLAWRAYQVALGMKEHPMLYALLGMVARRAGRRVPGRTPFFNLEGPRDLVLR